MIVRDFQTSLLLLIVIFAGSSFSLIEAQEAANASVHSRGSAMSVPTPTGVEPPVRLIDGKPTKFPAFHSPVAANDASAPVDEAPKNQFAIPAVTVTSSLAVVLGLFAAMVWLTRKFGSRSIAPGAIPREVFEHLGSSPIDARTRLTMIRCGSRILVLSQTATEVRSLSEITDPEEVRRLTAACLGDSKRIFASTLESLEKEPVRPGFANESPQYPNSGIGMKTSQPTEFDAPRPRGRLFTTTA